MGTATFCVKTSSGGAVLQLLSCSGCQSAVLSLGCACCSEPVNGPLPPSGWSPGAVSLQAQQTRGCRNLRGEWFFLAVHLGRGCPAGVNFSPCL